MLGFDVLIACAFNFDAHSTEFDRLGRVPILKARMNPDLHMADELKNTGTGNLFVVFGEPDIEIEPTGDNGSGSSQGRRRLRSEDRRGRIRRTDDIALWFIDTDYNEESFFVRHAYFLGAERPLQGAQDHAQGRDRRGGLVDALQRHLAPLPRPQTGRIAVKVINHLGDEVMKVFSE